MRGSDRSETSATRVSEDLQLFCSPDSFKMHSDSVRIFWNIDEQTDRQTRTVHMEKFVWEKGLALVISFSSFSMDFGGARWVLTSKSDSLMNFASGTQIDFQNYPDDFQNYPDDFQSLEAGQRAGATGQG